MPYTLRRIGPITFESSDRTYRVVREGLCWIVSVRTYTTQGFQYIPDAWIVASTPEDALTRYFRKDQ